MSKIAAMRELAQTRQKKLKAAIVAQQEVVIKLGPRIVSRLEAVWWGHHSKWGQELEREFGRLFYRCGVPPGLQDSYAPITLLQWIRVPNFRVSRFEWPEPIIAKPAIVDVFDTEALSEAVLAARPSSLNVSWMVSLNHFSSRAWRF